ncbi:uncharacterized protein IL334_005286 [Kwoniella shivajii]|uniref:Uncharacterized protein n=1 Tax=Kwoniella shivajii TaxID=564305 RepID=A0ABZ1D330_9TREE|nr:hypothetical protein IL334_005286 [Kwoniella shivajii]
MPPRIPARPNLEVVKLSFLLPWTSKRTTNPFPSEGRSTHAESSTMASARMSPLTPPRPLTIRKSLIHHHLSLPNPPAASRLLTLLQADRRELTISSGMALSSYAIRIGDYKTYRGIWRLMGERRIAPMKIVIQKLSQTLPSLNKTSENEGATHSEKNTGRIKYRYRVNRWSEKMFPPLPTLSSSTYSTQHLLQHLHYLILEGNPPDFIGALELSKASHDWSHTDSLELLNLYLAYVKKLPSSGEKIDGLELVDIYLNDTKGKVNKQTLHLIIKSLLPSSINKHQHQKKNLDISTNQILATISHFVAYHSITPGAETFRLLAKFAYNYQLHELGHLALAGWNDSISQLRNEVYTLDLNDPSESGDGKIRFRRIGSIKKRWSGVLKSYEELGWVIRTEQVQGLDGYVWLGEKGVTLKEELKVKDGVEAEAELEVVKPIPEVQSILHVREEKCEVLAQISEIPSKIEMVGETLDSIDNHQSNETHKPPYFVIIRDGSTIKIRSKSRPKDEQGVYELEDDKPVWE